MELGLAVGRGVAAAGVPAPATAALGPGVPPGASGDAMAETVGNVAAGPKDAPAALARGEDEAPATAADGAVPANRGRGRAGAASVRPTWGAASSVVGPGSSARPRLGSRPGIDVAAAIASGTRARGPGAPRPSLRLARRSRTVDRRSSGMIGGK